MSFDFSTLVTDRTQADVNRVKQIAEKIKNGTASESELAEFNSAAMKGAYNYTDLNRVTAAMEALKAKLEGYGYAVPGYQRIKVPHVLPEPEPTSRLPEGYLELTYIESTGTQYIDTGFKPNQNTRVVVDISATTSHTTKTVFGARIGYQNVDYTLWYASDTTLQSNYGDNAGTFSVGSIAQRLTIDKNKNVTSCGSYVYTNTANTFQSAYSMYLFGMNQGGTLDSRTVSAKLYSCQIYDNGALIRDFVPCKNASGVIGLYDLANGVFYQNAGSGAFAAGEEVSAPATASVAVVSDNVADYDLYTWYEFDWPTPEAMTIYLLNVSAFRSVIAVMKTTPNVPSDMANLMAQEANDIEKILKDINLLLINSTLAWYYSGDVFSGEV